MKIKSALLTQLSGSLGGMTGAHNRGGLYLRSRAVPVNQNTTRQQAVRDALSVLSQRWSNVLQPSQRDAWNLYGENVPLTDTLGDPRQASGIAHYVRSNVPRLQAGLATVDDGPTNYTLGNPPEGFAASIDATGSDLVVNWTGSPVWPSQIGSALLVYMGRPVGLGVNFFAGPYRLAGSVDGAAVAPTAPATITGRPYPVTTDTVKVFVGASITYADGRLSSRVNVEASISA